MKPPKDTLSLVCESLDNCSFNVEVRKIILSALSAVNPISCVENVIFTQGENPFICNTKVERPIKGKLLVCGFGKASQYMALGLLETMPDIISYGIVITKYINNDISKLLQPKILSLQGNHPIPGPASVLSTQHLLNGLKTNKNDVVVCLISGGGSALFTKPHPKIGIDKFQALTNELILSGANINEINIIRKHIDQVKGGRLAKQLAPASVISLILSDVVGDDLSVIASGPTVADESTFQEALNILRKYKIDENTFSSVFNFIQNGCVHQEEETIKKEDPVFYSTNNYIIGSNTIASDAAKKQAELLGFDTKILTNELSGEARNVARRVAKSFYQWESENLAGKPLCMIAGGETTVTVTGSGIGGRNQEFITALSQEFAGQKNLLAVSIATDGEDGPTNAAGGVITGETEEIAKRLGLASTNALSNNDTFRYLKKVGSLLFTGPTGTNVNDLVFVFRFSD